MCTAIPAKTDVNFYSRSATVDRISGTAGRARRCRGCSAYFCQKKHRLLANGCTTWWGGSGKGLARALDLIFSPSAPGCALPAKRLFHCHKGSIHLNWKKYVGTNSNPDSCAKTWETVSLIFLSRVLWLLDFRTCWRFAHCTLLLCSVNKPSTMTLFTGLVPDACS